MINLRTLLALSVFGIVCGFKVSVTQRSYCSANTGLFGKESRSDKTSPSITRLAARPGSDRRYVGEEIVYNSFGAQLKAFIRRVRAFFQNLFPKIFKFSKTVLSVEKSRVVSAAQVDEIAKQKVAAQKILAEVRPKLAKEEDDAIFAAKIAKATAAAEASLERERQAAISLAQALSMTPEAREEAAHFADRLAKANAAAEESLDREREAAREIAKIMKAAFLVASKGSQYWIT
jgi:hypothetical protein